MLLALGIILIIIGTLGAWMAANRFTPDVSLLVTLGFVAVIVNGIALVWR